MWKFQLISLLLTHTSLFALESKSDMKKSNVSESNCKQHLNQNISETPPIVKLVEAKFHTNDVLEELKSQSQECHTHQYLLPKTFQSLKFSCESLHYPTYWKFETPPHDNALLKDFGITKRRQIKSFWDTSTYVFYSNLTLNFKDPYFVPTIFCVGTKILGFNLTTTIKSADSNVTSFKLKVEIIPEYSGIPHFEEKRVGENKNCSVTLQFNTLQKKFLCGENSRPQIIHCNNPDECNSIFVLDDQDSGRGNVCNSTFSTDVCSSKQCVQLLPSYSPAVIICRDQAKNSIARRYFVYPPRNRSDTSPIMRLGRDWEIGPETIWLEANETKIYFGQNVTFKCTGAGAYYSYGFQWGMGIIYSDNFTILDCDEARESFNATIHSYQAQIVVQFNKTRDNLVNNSIKIVCLGPRWNKVDWIHSSIDVVVHEPERPKIFDHTEGPYVIPEFESSEDYWYNFSCIAKGNPIAYITWILNSHNLDNHFTGSSYKIAHYSFVDNGTTNSTLMVKLSRNVVHNVTCMAVNFRASDRYEFQVSPITDHRWKWLVIISIPVLLIILVGTFLLIRNHYRKKLQLLSDEEIEEFEKGNSKADTQALILPYSMDNEIPQDKITILDTSVLGEGQFGLVYKGLYQSRPVAIKTMKKTAEVRYIKALLSEIKIMLFVGRHDNLVNMVGACTTKMRQREIYLVIEFCKYGSLLRFLKESRGMCLDLFNTNETTNECSNEMKLIDINIQNDSVSVLPCINTLYLVNWSIDIANGLEYLANKKVVHGDLAARNVLLAEGLVAKVGDFGLSKQLYEDYAIYVQKLECPLPLKWLAIESLQDFEFSLQSDIWAFGITLWEIFSLGETPYPGIHWTFQSYILLKNGYRMEKPQFSNDNIYEVMMACWNSAPNARPSFSKIKRTFVKIRQSFLHNYKSQENALNDRMTGNFRNEIVAQKL